MDVRDISECDFSDVPQELIKAMAAHLLSFVENPEKGIGKILIDAIVKLVPLPCIEAIVVDDTENPTKILVIPRKDEHYQGLHFPGGLLYPGDTYEQTVHKVIKRELGVGIKRLKFTGVLNSGPADSRGFIVGAVFLVVLDAEPKAGTWFKHVPKTLLPGHKDFFKRTQKALSWESWLVEDS